MRNGAALLGHENACLCAKLRLRGQGRELLLCLIDRGQAAVILPARETGETAAQLFLKRKHQRQCIRQEITESLLAFMGPKSYTLIMPTPRPKPNIFKALQITIFFFCERTEANAKNSLKTKLCMAGWRVA
jgi:hypothetical protein